MGKKTKMSSQQVRAVKLQQIMMGIIGIIIILSMIISMISQY